MYDESTNQLIGELFPPKQPTTEEVVAALDAKVAELENQAQALTQAYESQVASLRSKQQALLAARDQVMPQDETTEEPSPEEAQG